VPDTGGFCGVRCILPLPDFPFRADAGEPEILHAEHAVRSLHGLLERGPVLVVGPDDLRPGGY